MLYVRRCSGEYYKLTRIDIACEEVALGTKMLKPDDSMDTGDTGENSVRFHHIWKCQSCWVRKRCGTIVSNIYEGS